MEVARPWALRLRAAVAKPVVEIFLRWPISRPFRPHGGGALFPRASAFGLGPGLGSPGPLGQRDEGSQEGARQNPENTDVKDSRDGQGPQRLGISLHAVNVM
jgi:hypothetical protein